MHEDQQVSQSELTQPLKGLGLIFLLALVVALLAVVAFAGLAEEVKEQAFTPFNTSVLMAIHGYSNPALDGIAKGLAILASPEAMTLLGLGFAGWLLAQKHRVEAWSLGGTLIGAAISTFALKGLLKNPRPELWPTIMPEHGFSFPSGHALMSFTFFGFLGIWAVLQAPRQISRWLVCIACFALAVLVSLSRLYLGVHWPTDVVAGFLVAMFWLAVGFAGREFLYRRLAERRRQRQLARSQG